MVYDLIYTVISPVWDFFQCVTPGEWLTCAGELIVAWVIFLELEHQRDVAFLAKATDKESDKDRREIYERFLGAKGTNDQRIKTFQEELNKPEATELRTHCHNQLAMFNEMGYQTDRWFRFKQDRYVSVFPHAPVFYWYIAGCYVRDRRALTGPWFGRHALNFIKASIEYVLEYKKDLTLSLPGKGPMILTVAEMKKMKAEITRLIAD
jgi:hypothetical protein